MWVFLAAGAVYLIGVAVILVVKPEFMFTPDGNWKEFGIGKAPEKYTPFPFWLFCLVWALLSYLLTILVVKLYPSSKQESRTRSRALPLPEFEEEQVFANTANSELPKGYYVLNKKATKLSGMPKYVYLGPEEPAEA